MSECICPTCGAPTGLDMDACHFYIQPNSEELTASRQELERANALLSSAQDTIQVLTQRAVAAEALVPKDGMVVVPDGVTDRDVLVAEYAYRQCEKGRNIQTTLIGLKNMLKAAKEGMVVPKESEWINVRASWADGYWKTEIIPYHKEDK